MNKHSFLLFTLLTNIFFAAHIFASKQGNNHPQQNCSSKRFRHDPYNGNTITDNFDPVAFNLTLVRPNYNREIMRKLLNSQGLHHNDPLFFKFRKVSNLLTEEKNRAMRSSQRKFRSNFKPS